MKAALWILGLLAGGFIVLMIAVGSDNRTPWQKVEQSCEKEYAGRGEIAINDCKIRVGLKRLQENEKDTLSRAERGAR